MTIPVLDSLTPLHPHYAYYTLVVPLLLWEQAVALSIVFSLLSLSLIPLCLSSIRLPPLFQFSPSRLHSSPGEMGEGEWESEKERERERQDRPALLKTLFMPCTKQHVISALGETQGVGRREGLCGLKCNHNRTMIILGNIKINRPAHISFSRVENTRSYLFCTD